MMNNHKSTDTTKRFSIWRGVGETMFFQALHLTNQRCHLIWLKSCALFEVKLQMVCDQVFIENNILVITNKSKTPLRWEACGCHLHLVWIEGIEGKRRSEIWSHIVSFIWIPILERLSLAFLKTNRETLSSPTILSPSFPLLLFPLPFLSSTS